MAKGPGSQCRGTEFDPWSENEIPHATIKSSHATTKTQHSQIKLFILNLQTTNAREDVEKKEHSYTVGGNVSWYSHYGKKYGGSSEN